LIEVVGVNNHFERTQSMNHIFVEIMIGSLTKRLF